MKLLNFFKKSKKMPKNSSFSDFFLHASIEEKKAVFTKAAEGANEDQREVFKKLKLKLGAE